MSKDPDLLTEEFYSVAGGYLAADIDALKEMAAKLPEPQSERERGIRAAIIWGINHPYEWKKLQVGNRKLKRTPEQAMKDQGNYFDLSAV